MKEMAKTTHVRVSKKSKKKKGIELKTNVKAQKKEKMYGKTRNLRTS
jgi:hypothetical protein